MSLETLLEAAKFVEWSSAQVQHNTRGMYNRSTCVFDVYVCVFSVHVQCIVFLFFQWYRASRVCVICFRALLSARNPPVVVDRAEFNCDCKKITSKKRDR